LLSIRDRPGRAIAGGCPILGLEGGPTIPIELEYLDAGGMLFIATGKVTGNDLLEANRTIYETEEKTLASVYQICDYRGTDSVDVSTADIRKLAERDKRAAGLLGVTRRTLSYRISKYGLEEELEEMRQKSRSAIQPSLPKLGPSPAA
jgi:hypothetical protein